ncbi:YbhN family protein [Rhodococcus sp. X156]|uniref:lysylphosphatidylglycerol synthase transmembrane domain-containing protein n=1 Tax=Rhodococcus sp. X156 TaxID=2499145 RepID=UPI000FD9188F|nr:YbhN family protein [Rhodococcus sp. X156]
MEKVTTSSDVARLRATAWHENAWYTALHSVWRFPRRHRTVLRQAVGAVLTYGIVAAIFWAIVTELSAEADNSASLDLIQAWQVVALVSLGLVLLLSNAPALMIALPGQTLRQAVIANTAGTAVSNTLPEGGAVATGLTFAMTRSWGFRLAEIARSVLVVDVGNSLVRYTLGGIALAVLATQPGSPQVFAVVAAAVLVVVALAVVVLAQVLRSESFARRVGSLVGTVVNAVLRRLHRQQHPDLPGRVAELRVGSAELVRQRWLALTVAIASVQLINCLALGAALHLQGVVEVSWARVVVAYAGTALISLLMPSPGGLGVAEGSLLTILGNGFGTVSSTPELVSAVLLYRMATWLLPTVVGLFTYLYWRRTQHARGRRSTQISQPAAES